MAESPVLRTLNGRAFAQLLRAGTLMVIRERETLNRINVFPIADADTGVNLAATLKAAVARLGDESPEAVGDAARMAADAALDGARGSSGAIMAQFLDGLAAAFRDRACVDTREFAAAADTGAKAASRRCKTRARARSSRCSGVGRRAAHASGHA